VMEVLEADVSNPGQVLACLGLLEVLDLMSPGSAGAFFSEKEFHIESGATISSALASLRGATIEEEHLYPEPPPWGGDKAWPIVLDSSFGTIVLDPWLEPDHSDIAKGLKLWAGRLTTTDLLRGLIGSLPLNRALPVLRLFDWEASGTPSGLDPRSAVSKEDLGFSYNSQKLKPVIYPVVDFFAMVGLEGARPPRTGPLTYSYRLWDQLLPPLIARATLTGALPALASSRWIYRVDSRGLGGTYRYLSMASPEEEAS
jgi:hypothetical protein